MREILLPAGQRLAGGDAQLPLDQILAGDHLGHRMLDLEARVHLHEVEGAALVDDELDRARADIADGLGGRDGGCAHLGAPRRRHAGGRRLLDDLLVAALERAVALEEMQRIAVAVGEHLDLDMARPLEIFFDEQQIVAERRLRLRAWRRASASSRSSAAATTRMPLPPPPAEALISTG